MDGHYVPNLALAPDHLTALRPHTRLYPTDVARMRSDLARLEADLFPELAEQRLLRRLVALHAASPGSLSRATDLRSGKPAEGGEALEHTPAAPSVA